MSTELGQRLEPLKAMLDMLGLDVAIENVGARKAIQKAVYLAQRLAGVDLGYRYNWYIMGPYSPDLTTDYYALAAVAHEDRLMFEDEASNSALKNLRSMLTPPSNVTLAQPEWLELIASIDYLRHVSKHDEAKVESILKKTKPSLFQWLKQGKKALRDHP